MSLRELVEGDCGGPGPLTSFTTHLVQDRGFRDDGIGQSHIVPFENTDENQLVDEYLDNHVNVNPQTFRMDNILHEVHDIDHKLHQQLPQIEQNCDDQDTEWACQFLENRSEFYEHNSDSIWAENVHQPEPSSLSSSTVTGLQQDANEFGLGMRWAEDYFEHSLENKNDDVKDLKDTSRSSNFGLSKFMKFMHQDGEASETLKDNEVIKSLSSQWAQEFSHEQNPDLTNISEIDKNVLDGSTVKGPIGLPWADEFSATASGEIKNDTFKTSETLNLENEWAIASSKEDNESHPWLSDYESFYDPFKDYKFSSENPMKNIDNALEKGKERLEAGDLPSAVLCFESAVQQDENNTEAWLLLGKTQAENEQDPLAIAALKKCLTLDNENLSALMTLAVSYTNESYQNQACIVLKEWLIKNDKYNKILSFKSSNVHSKKSTLSTLLFNDLYEDVKDLFIQAARIKPTDEIDADVQSGLGVLFNLSNEYDKAIDCFQTALQVRPDDSRLWNRLGATMANGQNSAEAIDAYSKALELSPGFIRARYNLGISCINLGAYKEAGEHLLTALNQQAAGRGLHGESSTQNAMSDTIWSTMRLVISFLHKYDLYDAVDKRDLEKLNKEFDIS